MRKKHLSLKLNEGYRSDPDADFSAAISDCFAGPFAPPL